jgi:glutamate dehydrogenase
VALAFEATRRIFDLDALCARVNALDNRVAAAAQTALHQDIAMLYRRVTPYLARFGGFDRERPRSVLEIVQLYREPVAAQRAQLWDELSEVERARVEARRARFVELGAPEDLANDVALLLPLTTALDVADLARRAKWPIHEAALLHCAVGAQFSLDALRGAAGALSLDRHWDRLLVRRAIDDFSQTQLKLSEAAAAAIGAPAADLDAAVTRWVGSVGQPAQRARAAYAELDAEGPWTAAKLMLISAELASLVDAVR